MSLEDSITKLSLYDAKKYFRKAQNVVFNYTEMEAKVREATNNEPWGASSTLMEKIAQGTYNYREREEILGMIFRRFTEKTASEWRQIYKALQLLEYLIKHGSERFIDDVRNNLNLVKMLESFHYIDSQGRDQGINVRNRASQLVKLLESDEMIRQERKKARETMKKYKGVAGGIVPGMGANVNSRAGYTRSTNQGISVSADFDSDDDDGYQKPQPYGLDNGNSKSSYNPNEEYEPRQSEGSSDLLDIQENEGAKNKKQDQQTNSQAAAAAADIDDDDDEDFAEFQSATPSAPVSNRLDDLVFSNDNSFATPSHPHAPATAVTPAIAEAAKASDPFGSLFSSAKKEPFKTTVTASTTGKTETASNPVAHSDDADLFGDLQPAPNSQKSNGNHQQPATQNHSEEIDLLSF
ncbi:epsin-3 [Kluyveromyces marxianus DMKU3-1042]|uniref:Epsin-3 n=1 Tax=Kluyveromyces marxianus (strain DMKU3-1042 / BCC 29191 / NBRC 104275) TaxID=1003335 RepID=W0TBS5_KLUMD|nr:epsin-3 [Kluyveromyces marxianus DMKU3-1042]BAO40473.1 epsin-3 [Kluyveromyces marxianus DMKU3-1042]